MEAATKCSRSYDRGKVNFICIPVGSEKSHEFVFQKCFAIIFILLKQVISKTNLHVPEHTIRKVKFQNFKKISK